MEQIALYVGYGTIIVVGITLSALLLWLAWHIFEEVFRTVIAWFTIGDFDLWITYKQFGREYYSVLGRKDCTICPHCGGTGRLDDDDYIRDRLNSLHHIATKHQKKFLAFCQKQDMKNNS